MANKQGNPTFSAYAEEVAAHLGMMKEGEVRGIGSMPAGLQKTYLTYYLKKAGWERGYHYRTFREGRCPVTRQLLPLTPRLLWYEKIRNLKVRAPRPKK